MAISALSNKSLLGIWDQLASGINEHLLAPGAIGTTTPAAIAATTLSATGNSMLRDTFVADGYGVVVGHTAQVTIGSTREVEILGTSSIDASLAIARWSADNAGPYLIFGKSRSVGIGGSAIVQANDDVGGILWYAADGVNLNSSCAQIVAQIDATPGATDTPGRIVFRTAADGSGSPTDRATIDRNGNVGIGVTPESWSSDRTVLQLGGVGAVWGMTAQAAGSDIQLTTNAYKDDIGINRYIVTDEAAKYQQLNGAHIFSAADSGTADAPITWTEILRLRKSEVVVNEDSADIDFRVGSDVNTHALFVEGTNGRSIFDSSAPNIIELKRNGGTDANAAMQFMGAGGNYWAIGRASDTRFAISLNQLSLASGAFFYMDATKNIAIAGASSWGTSAQGVLAIGNGVAPDTSPSNSVQLWAEDVAASSELKVRDEAGNVTGLSPHNFTECGGPSEEMAWAYYSERDGTIINVDMLAVVRAVERMSGQKLVYIVTRER